VLEAWVELWTFVFAAAPFHTDQLLLAVAAGVLTTEAIEVFVEAELRLLPLPQPSLALLLLLLLPLLLFTSFELWLPLELLFEPFALFELWLL